MPQLLRALDFEAVVCLRTWAVTPVRPSARGREAIMQGLSAAGALPHGLLKGSNVQLV